MGSFILKYHIIKLEKYRGIKENNRQEEVEKRVREEESPLTCCQVAFSYSHVEVGLCHLPRILRRGQSPLSSRSRGAYLLMTSYRR